MEMLRRPADELIELARALLLFQGAILIATTIEALVWAMLFPGANGSPALMSGASALALLVARARLPVDRRWARRVVYLVESIVLLTAAVNVAIGLVLAHALPPVVAILTEMILPLSAIALLRRSTRLPRSTVLATPPSEGVS